MRHAVLAVGPVVAALMLALPAQAPAAVAEGLVPVVGPSDGLRIVKVAGGYQARFGRRADRLYRKIAGRTVKFECARVRTAGPGGVARADVSSTQTVRARRARGRLTAALDIARADVCTLAVRADEGFGCDEGWCPVAIQPLTKAGRVRVGELQVGADLSVMLLRVMLVAQEDRWPEWTTLTAELDDVRSGAPDDPDAEVVLLPGPDGAPARPGPVGYWTDGAIVVLAARGLDHRRYFVRIEGDVLSTNVPDWIAPRL